jgi:hypothetical protein
VAAPSKAWVCGRSLAGIVGLDTAGGKDVSFLVVLCVSGRSICIMLITSPEESYQVCVCMCVCLYVCVCMCVCVCVCVCH